MRTEASGCGVLAFGCSERVGMQQASLGAASESGRVGFCLILFVGFALCCIWGLPVGACGGLPCALCGLRLVHCLWVSLCALLRLCAKR